MNSVLDNEGPHTLYSIIISHDDVNNSDELHP